MTSIKPSTAQQTARRFSPAPRYPAAALKQSIALVHPLAQAAGLLSILRIRIIACSFPSEFVPPLRFRLLVHDVFEPPSNTDHEHQCQESQNDVLRCDCHQLKSAFLARKTHREYHANPKTDEISPTHSLTPLDSSDALFRQ